MISESDIHSPAGRYKDAENAGQESRRIRQAFDESKNTQANKKYNLSNAHEHCNLMKAVKYIML